MTDETPKPDLIDDFFNAKALMLENARLRKALQRISVGWSPASQRELAKEALQEKSK